MKESNTFALTSKTDRKTRRCPIECFMEAKDGKTEVNVKSINDDEGTIYQTLTGTPNDALAMSVIDTAIAALPKGMNYAKKHNIIFQTLADSTPRDAHEARLCVQASVLYVQGMDFLNRARDTLFDDGTFAKQEWHTILMKTATKLLDLHNKTIESLTRYRQQGKQEIIVQHINIESVDKAIIGEVNGGGGQQQKNDEIPLGHSTNLQG